MNNQIGFTTSPAYSRSSPYPTDVGKMVMAPILHVNGDDPEAVVHSARIAVEFKQAFKTDVIIDMFCYRRFGHNEGDEPSFTQPLMYKKIKDHPSTRELYARQLIAKECLRLIRQMRLWITTKIILMRSLKLERLSSKIRLIGWKENGQDWVKLLMRMHAVASHLVQQIFCGKLEQS